MQTKYDILLKGGIVVDPVNRSTGVADVAIADGKIMEIGQIWTPAGRMKALLSQATTSYPASSTCTCTSLRGWADAMAIA